MSENGEVCTWQAISGATEQGRAFADYADCKVVRTQRPYYPLPPHTGEQEPDPRMSNEEYVEETSWAASQIRTTGCACCHSLAAEMGPVRWTIDAPGNWVNTMNDRDLAASAEWISTAMFGRLPPEMNNGAERRYGFPSSDPERMRRFFENELAHRGRARAEFDDAPPTGGPLLEQAAYLPSACEGGEGVKADGVIAWSGGPARYIYVLERASANPTIPPNLDLPEGTLWRIDVPHDGTPLAPGSVRYGVVPRGAIQDHPVDGAAPMELESGEEYYLYVTRDVSQPITRCIFKAP